MQLMSFLCRFQFQTSSSVLVWDRGKDSQGLQLSVITGGAVFQLEYKTMNSTAVVFLYVGFVGILRLISASVHLLHLCQTLLNLLLAIHDITR